MAHICFENVGAKKKERGFDPTFKETKKKTVNKYSKLSLNRKRQPNHRVRIRSKIIKKAKVIKVEAENNQKKFKHNIVESIVESSGMGAEKFDIKETKLGRIFQNSRYFPNPLSFSV